MSGHCVRVARVYEERSAADGLRVLVDRMWPRGLSKDSADLDLWCKAIAPSTELRQWYGHVPARFADFRKRYLAELADPAHADALAQLCALAQDHDLTLLTATKNVEGSQAAVLAEQLQVSARAQTPDG
jgi:uncharacterized protein YeaO (DUF488 family)